MRLINVHRYGSGSSIISLSLNHNISPTAFNHESDRRIGCVDVALTMLLDRCATTSMLNIFIAREFDLKLFS